MIALLARALRVGNQRQALRDVNRDVVACLGSGWLYRATSRGGLVVVVLSVACVLSGRRGIYNSTGTTSVVDYLFSMVKCGFSSGVRLRC